MDSTKSTEDSLREWQAWESRNGLNAAENIGQARSPEYRQDRELRYAASRAWKELDEAIKRAEAVDQVEKGEDIDFSNHFEYTVNNEDYNTESVSDYEQLMDEFGFELADTTLFILKMTTATKSGFGSEDYEPGLEEMAQVLESPEDTVQQEYTKATTNINNLFNPKTEGSMYSEVMARKTDKQKVAEYSEQIIRNITSMAAHLPKDLSEYVSEKIEYNISQREIDEMDADHPNPEPEFKRNSETE